MCFVFGFLLQKVASTSIYRARSYCKSKGAVLFLSLEAVPLLPLQLPPKPGSRRSVQLDNKHIAFGQANSISNQSHSHGSTTKYGSVFFWTSFLLFAGFKRTTTSKTTHFGGPTMALNPDLGAVCKQATLKVVLEAGTSTNHLAQQGCRMHLKADIRQVYFV